MELNALQQKLNQAFHGAQEKAVTRAKELEQEARKVLETLGDRAQAEVKTLLMRTRTLSRDQLSTLGVELEKLGKRLQELAAKAKTEQNGTQPTPPTVQ
jgi:hypothetical protein